MTGINACMVDCSENCFPNFHFLTCTKKKICWRNVQKVVQAEVQTTNYLQVSRKVGGLSSVLFKKIRFSLYPEMPVLPICVCLKECKLYLHFQKYYRPRCFNFLVSSMASTKLRHHRKECSNELIRLGQRRVLECKVSRY